MAKEYKFKIGFDVNKDDILKIIESIDRKINELNKKKIVFDADTGKIDNQIKKLNQFKELLNNSTGIYNATDARRFANELNKIGHSVQGFEYILKSSGIESKDFFDKLRKHLKDSRIEIEETKTFAEELGKTFLNAFRWSVASIAVHRIESFFTQGYYYVKELDSSLNNIRVVTGKSAEEMEQFAKQANKAAIELGRTTKEYADAALLFFQQGRTAKEVDKLTKATLVSANITGQSVEETAELITAALNGYTMAADKAMEVADKFAAVGASTGANFKELAIGFSKVASMAKVVGVNFDQLNAILATVLTVTRESPESIGTSFKAIFGRMSELKAGKSDEEGWTTGKVEQALNKVGLSLIDKQTGQMKELGRVIDELGQKWANLNRESKLAISTALAGTRQQNRFIALLDNYQMYQDALNTSIESAGAAEEQNAIRLDSIEVRLRKIRTQVESIWDTIINSDVIKDAISGISNLIELFESLTKGVNNTYGAISLLGFTINTMFSKIIAKSMATGGLNKLGQGIQDLFGVSELQNRLKKETAELDRLLKEKQSGKKITDIEIERQSTVVESVKNAKNISKYLDQDTIETIEMQYREIDKLYANIIYYNGVLEKLTEKVKENNNQQINDLIKQNKELKEQIGLLQLKKQEINKTLNPKDLESLNNIKNKFNSVQKNVEQEGRMRILQGTPEYDALIKSGIRTNNKSKGFYVTAKDIEQINLYLEQQNDRLQEQKQIEQDIILLTEKKKQAEIEIAHLKSGKVNSEELEKIRNEINIAQQEIEARKAQIEEPINIAQKTASIQKTIDWLTSAATIIPVVINGFQTITNLQGTMAEKGEQVAGVIQGLGMAAMTLPFGWAKAAGIAIIGVSRLVDVIVKQLDRVYQAQERNKKILEDTQKLLNENTEKTKKIYQGRPAYEELKYMMQGGAVQISQLNKEQIQKYRELANVIAETIPEAVAYYDEAGNAVIDLTMNLDELIKKQRELKTEIYEMRANNKDSFNLEYAIKLKENLEKINKLESKLQTIKSSEEKASIMNEITQAKAQVEEYRKYFKENVAQSLYLGNKNIVNIMNQNFEGKEELLIKLKKITESQNILEALNEGNVAKLNVLTSNVTNFYNALDNTTISLEKLNKIDLGVLDYIKNFSFNEESARVMLDTFGQLYDNINKLQEVINSPDKFNKEVMGKAFQISEQELDQQIKTKEEELRKIQEAYNKSSNSAGGYVGINTATIRAGAIMDFKSEIENLQNSLEKLRVMKAEISDANAQYIKFLESLAKTPEGIQKLSEAYNKNYEEIEKLKKSANAADEERLKKIEEVAKRQLYALVKSDQEFYKQHVLTNDKLVKVLSDQYGINLRNFTNLQSAELNYFTQMRNQMVNIEALSANERAKILNNFSKWMKEKYNRDLNEMVESEWKSRSWLQRAFYTITFQKNNVKKDIENKIIQRNMDEYLADTQNKLKETIADSFKLNSYTPKLPKIKTTTGTNITGNGKNGSSNRDTTSSNMEKELDILHDTNVVLKQKEALITSLQKKEKELYGDELYKNIKAQNAALREKKMLLEAQIKLIDQEMAAERKKLAAAGVKFDKEGRITNYNAFIQTKMNQVNSIKDKNKFETAKKNAEDLFKLMEKYENYYINVKIDKQQAIEEINSQLRENILKDIEFKLNVQLDLVSDKDEFLNFLKEVKTNFEDLDEQYSILRDSINNTVQKINYYKEAIDKVKNSNLTTKDKIELLEKYEKGLMDTTKVLANFDKQLQDLNNKTLQETEKLLNYHLKQFDDLNADLSFISKNLAAINQQNNYILKANIADAQANIALNQIEAIKGTRDALIEYRDSLKKGTDEWKAANDEVERLNGKINDLTTTALEAYKSKTQNQLSQITSDLEKQLFNGQNYKDFKADYDFLKAQQDKYLSNEEKIIALGELQRQIEQDINETYDERNKEILEDFYNTQLKALKEKDKLTRYDVERAQKIYDITKKQIALQEMQNNKTIMKLVRDAQGNWSYQYVADTKKVQEAQVQLSQSLRDLMEYDKTQLDKTQQEMINLKYQFIQQIQDIIQAGLNGQYASQEEMYAAIEKAQQRFNEQITLLENERFNISVNVSESALGAILDTYKITTDELNILVPEQEALLEQMAINVGNKWSEISTISQALLNGDYEYLRDVYKLNVENEYSNLSETVKGLHKSISENWTDALATMLGTTITNRTNMEKELNGFKDNVNGYINSIKTTWGEYQTKVVEVTGVVNPLLTDVNSNVQGIIDKNNILKKETPNVTSVVKEQLNAIQKVIGSMKDLIDKYPNLTQSSIDYVTQVNEEIQAIKDLNTELTRTNQIKDQTAKNPVPSSIPVPAPIKGNTSNSSSNGSTGGKNNDSFINNTPTTSKPSYDNYGLTTEEAKKLQRLANDIAGYNLPVDGYLGKKSWEALSSSYFAGKIRVLMQDFDRNTAKRVQLEGKYTLKVLQTALKIANTPLEKLPKFDTGGYTGEWLDNKGRLAVLHKKEIVLNKQDTSNLLKSVQIVRDFSKLFINRTQAPLPITPQSATPIQPIVTINAAFPNVSSSDEIKKAFDNLENRAAQYIRNFIKK